MAAFRRCILALVVLAVFAGLASAQTSVPATCTLNSTADSVRVESKSDQVGDMTIVCTGGTLLANDALVPRITFSVTLTTPVTSRILVAAAGTNPAVTDALLTIDEPGAGGGLIPNFGPNQAPTPCTSNLSPGCTAPIYSEVSTVNFYPVASSNTGSPSSSPGTAPNVFQGVLTGANTVTFYGVPVLAPVSNGVARVFRLTNLRTDSTTATVASTVTASITTACTTATNCTSAGSVLQLSSSTATVATVASGLSATNTSATAFSSTACATTGGSSSPYTPKLIGTISLGEGFGSAFRTRQNVSGTVGGALTNATNNPNQIVPGGNFIFTESGLVVPGVQGTSVTVAGLADFGTRLKATFSNVPTGVRLFVSTTNLINGLTVTISNQSGSNVSTSLAQLLVNSSAAAEFASDGSTPTFISPTTTGSDGSNVAQIGTTSGAGTAVWEVTNTKGAAQETLVFGVYVQYAGGAPVTGTGGTAPTPTVVLSFAPTGALPTGVTVNPEPFFVVANTTAFPAFNLSNCRTILLFPFVTSSFGFDTGLAISNTTTDPFGTAAQTGTCTFNFYGSGAPATTPAAVSVPSGTSYAQDASVLAPGFSGYMIAVCNFQFAHGFAFISKAADPFNGTMGYLPEIIPDPGTGASAARGVTSAGGIQETLTF